VRTAAAAAAATAVECAEPAVDRPHVTYPRAVQYTVLVVVHCRTDMCMHQET
jgi:hypothetical protein